MDPLNQQTAGAAAVIADLAKTTVIRHQPLPFTDAQPALVWPDKTITPLESYLPQPTAKRADAKLVDPESFSSYVNAHKQPGTVIVGDADENGGGFMAFLDYHLAEDKGDPNKRAAWAEHRARMPLEKTPEWARWLGKSGATLNQVEFAEFLEDNVADVVVPEGDAGRGFPNQQELMSVALTLSVKTDVKFGSSVRLANGQVQVGYVEQIEGGHGTDGRMTIPEKFAIGLALFRGCPKYCVTLRLRYRATQGRCAFTFTIERPHKYVEATFNDVRKIITDKVGLPVLVGSLTPQTRRT